MLNAASPVAHTATSDRTGASSDAAGLAGEPASQEWRPNPLALTLR